MVWMYGFFFGQREPRHHHNLTTPLTRMRRVIDADHRALYVLSIHPTLSPLGYCMYGIIKKRKTQKHRSLIIPQNHYTPSS